MSDPLVTFMDDLIAAATRYKAAVTPTPEPEPTPPPVPRQPIFAWIGAAEADGMVNGWSGWRPLNEFVGAVDGFVIAYPEPDQSINWKRIQSKGFKVYGAVTLQNQGGIPNFDARYALDRMLSWGVDGLAYDCEPYGHPDDRLWDWRNNEAAERKAMLTKGLQHARPVPTIVYPSSNASWPGSYNDLVLVNAGVRDAYTRNVFADFMEGLISGGADVTHTDAVFHSGPQLPGVSWEQGFKMSVAAVQKSFPEVHGSAMLWPDKDEGSTGHIAPAEVVPLFESATRVCTGPVILYQHTLIRPGATYPWSDLLGRLRSLRDERRQTT